MWLCGFLAAAAADAFVEGCDERVFRAELSEVGCCVARTVSMGVAGTVIDAEVDVVAEFSGLR